MGSPWQGIRLSVPSDKRYLEPIRCIVREGGALLDLTEEEGNDVVLAVQEALANVIRHCYKEHTNKRIDVCLSFSVEHFEIRIDDYGTFVDPSSMRGRDLKDVKPGGLGIHFMRRVMDEVRYDKNAWGGTTLTLRKQLAPGRKASAAGEPASGA